MRGIVLVLLFFVLLQSCQAYFPRPWENQTWLSANPYISIYGFELWFDLVPLHTTITSINNDSLNQLNISGISKSHVSLAQKYVARADTDLDMCQEKLSDAALSLPFSLFDSAFDAFKGITYCTDYGTAWRGAVEYILSALEDAATAADDSVSAARSSYEEVRFAGLCDPGYVYGGSENCAEFNSAFASVDGLVPEGKYGKYALFSDYSAKLKEELLKPAPDLQDSAYMLGLVWTKGGIIDTFRSLRALANISKASAEADYSAFYQSALSKKASVNQEMGALKSERLDMIDRSPASSLLRMPGSVSENLNAMDDMVSNLSSSLDNARILHGRLNQRGYLASSVMLAAESDSAYTWLLGQIGLLETDAKEILDQQKTEAEGEISKTEAQFSSELPSPEGSNLLQEAKDTYASAPGLKTIGERYSAYSRSAALARAARTARGLQEEADIRASLAGLESAVAAAEKDGINVVPEKESLGLLKGMTDSDIRPYIKDAMDSIIMKERAKYEDALLSERKNIIDKLALAGAQGLSDEFVASEEGIVKDGSIVFPDSIGKLATLKDAYAKIDQELEAYMSKIVGNAMSVSASPVVGVVRLDQPTDTTLDLVLNNDRNYTAALAEVRISLDSPQGFLYSDIVSGKENVESVRTTDGGKTLILVLRDVRPFETMRVVFKKSSVIAHTLSVQSVAQGTGNDAAHLSSTIEFELDSGVKGILPKYQSGEVLVDGSSPNQPLEAGQHTMAVETDIEDAYSETMENVKAYATGPNSRVEYQIVITPNMDLESVPVTLDSLNDSRISSFQAECAVGCQIKSQKRLSETQYSVVLEGLKKGMDATLSVSYTVERTAEYVQDQISILDHDGLCPDALALIDEAKASADSGDQQNALVLIEKAKTAQKEYDAGIQKDDKKADDITAKLQNEIDTINGALDSAKKSDEFQSLNSSFVDKLETRKEELEKTLNESDQAGTDKLNTLANTDTEWLGNQVSSMKKDLYKQYNDLKERFYNTGNTTTPQEFIDFESAFNKLDATQKLEYGLDAMAKLEGVKSVVQKQEAMNASGMAGLPDVLQGMKAGVSATLDAYRRESAAAKGTNLSSMFTENDKTVDKIITDAEGYATTDPKKFWLKMDELNKSDGRMQLVIDSLKKDAESKLSLIEGVFAQKELDDAQRKEIGVKIDALRGLIANSQFVNALRSASDLIKELDSIKPKDNSGIIVLGLTAMAVLGGIGFYMLRQQKEPVRPRKLASISDGPNHRTKDASPINEKTSEKIGQEER